MADTVTPADADPGDLVFLSAADCAGRVDALGALITELDGSPFSHVGFVDLEGRVVSARTRQLSWPEVDVGGVIADTFETLAGTGRTISLGRTSVAPEVVERAVRMVDPWLEPTAGDDRSSFSFAKLFMVAAALDTVRRPTPTWPDLDPETSAELLLAAMQAAQAWHHDRQAQAGFFCAELVAVAFDARFTVADLTPPPAGRDGPLRSLGDRQVQAEGVGGIAHLSQLARRIVEEAPDGPQLRALWRLIRIATRSDATFVSRTAAAAAEFLADRLGLVPGVREVTLDEHTDPPSPTDPLPAALVTPRMLSRAEWVEWVRPMRV